MIKLIWIKLAVLVLLLSLLSMLIGPVSIVDALVNWQDDKLPELSTILWEIRAPRTLLGLMVGGALGMSGAAMQGLLRNPLAEPSLVGASSGAALGAVIALYSGLSSAFYLALPIAGFCGAALVSVMVIALAGLNAEITVIILAGSAGSALCAALISLVLNFSPNPHAGIEIVFWLMGSLADRSWDEVTLDLVTDDHRLDFIMVCWKRPVSNEPWRGNGPFHGLFSNTASRNGINWFVPVGRKCCFRCREHWVYHWLG